MRVAHVIDSGGLYGAEMVLLALMEEQRRSGLRPVLISSGDAAEPPRPLEVEARDRGLEAVAVRFGRLSLGGGRRLLGAARDAGADLLHTHGYKVNVLIGNVSGRARGLPVVTTLHGWTAVGGLSRLRLYQWLERRSLRRVDRVVVVQPGMLLHAGLQGCRERMRVIPNGIAEPRVDPPPADDPVVDFCRGGFAVGGIGRLSPEKGFDVAVDAVAALGREGLDARLVLLGDGPLRSTLERQVERLGLRARVLFRGYVPRAARYLPGFRALVQPSLTEGLPITLLEAMFLGVPVVASAVGGVPYLLREGACGTLVAPRRPAELAAALRAVRDDPDRSAALAARARRVALEEHSAAVMSERYAAVYRELGAGPVAAAGRVG